MLEILRVVATGLDDKQNLIVGGVEQLPRRLRKQTPETTAHWPMATSLSLLHGGAPQLSVVRLALASVDAIAVTDRWGDTRLYKAVLATCQSCLLTTSIECGEELFS